MVISVSSNVASSATADLITGSCGESLLWEYMFDDYLKTGMLFIKGHGDMYDYSSPSDFPWHAYRKETIWCTIGEDVSSITEGAFFFMPNLDYVDFYSVVPPKLTGSIVSGNRVIARVGYGNEATDTPEYAERIRAYQTALADTGFAHIADCYNNYVKYETIDHSGDTWNQHKKMIRLNASVLGEYSTFASVTYSYTVPKNTCFAIKKDGSLWGWGNGMTGDGTDAFRDKPVKILEDVICIRATDMFAYALQSDGTLWSWWRGISRSPLDRPQLSPKKIMSGVAAICTGYSDGNFFGMLAIKLDGSLWYWGRYSDYTQSGSVDLANNGVKIMKNIKSVQMWDYFYSTGTTTEVVCYAYAVSTDGRVYRIDWSFDKNIIEGDIDKKTTVSAEGSENIKISLVKQDVVKDIADEIYDIEIIDGFFARRYSQWPFDIESRPESPAEFNDRISNVVAYSGGKREFDFLVLKGDGTLWYTGQNSGLEWNGVDHGGYFQVMDDVRFPDEAPGLTAGLPSAWAKAEVNLAIAAGLVPESLHKNYRGSVTRGEVAQMFINLIEKASGQTIDALLDLKGVQIDVNVFTDTSDKAVLTAHALGIIDGVGNNRFNPGGALTRAQIAVIINRVARTLGAETEGYTHSFTDVSDHWADPELGWPVHAGIIQGVGNNRFNPNGKLTTEMAITVAYRALIALRS